MTTSDQEDQAERRRILREQAATYHQFAESELAQPRGRFAEAEGRQHLAGSDPLVKYPAASTPWQGPDLVGLERPLGYSVDAMFDSESPTGVSPVSSPVATDDPAHAPSSGSLVQQPWRWRGV
jgi:hypothetical protein